MKPLSAFVVLLVGSGIALGQQAQNVALVVAKVEGDSLTYTMTTLLQQVEYRDTVKEVDGKKILEKVPVTVSKPVDHMIKLALKDLQAIGSDGKEIAAKDLTEMLKEPKPIVHTVIPLSAEHRKLFRDGTIFIHNKIAK